MVKTSRSAGILTGKMVFSLIFLAVTLTPFWFYLFIKWVLSPQGFWQNLVALGLGVCFLGTFQTIFLIIWIVCMFGFWKKER